MSWVPFSLLMGALQPLAGAARGARTFELIKMEAKSRSQGAVCLDGTPGAFYISEAPEEHRREGQWMIHLEGGGWCYDELTCYNRSQRLEPPVRGSSLLYPPKGTAAELGLGGILSDNCTENPTFCNFTFVIAKYCDGASFSGNRDDPVVYTDASGKQTQMWFRGRRILDAVLDTLIESYSLGSASDVLLGGDSAGGLAVFSQGNYIQKRLQRGSSALRGRGIRLRLAPNSGFFLDHDSTEGKMVWQEQMRYLYGMSNWTQTDNACSEAYAKELEWLCLFPQNSYKFIKPPIFVLNSALDLYQVQNILAAEPITGFPNGDSTRVSNASAAPGWATCSGGEAHIENCSHWQIGHMNTYMDSFVALISESHTFRTRGNGAFVYGCFNHNAEMNSLDYSTYNVGGVSMQQALSAWWRAEATHAHEHTHVETGRYSYPASVKDANPSCNYVWDGYDV